MEPTVCGKCGNEALADEYFIHDGIPVRGRYCWKCGWRPKHRITVDDEPLARREGRFQICRNCGREKSIRADGLCFFCFDHRDDLKTARFAAENELIGQGSKAFSRAKEVGCGMER